jgi:heptaprenylglyceryl phosphate synthase
MILPAIKTSVPVMKETSFLRMISNIYEAAPINAMINTKNKYMTTHMAVLTADHITHFFASSEARVVPS